MQCRWFSVHRFQHLGTSTYHSDLFYTHTHNVHLQVQVCIQKHDFCQSGFGWLWCVKFPARTVCDQCYQPWTLWGPEETSCGTSWACWAFSGVMSSRAWFVHTARNRMSSQTSSPPLSQWIGKMGNPFKQGCSYSLIYIIYIYIFIFFKHIQTKRENPMLTPREFLSLKGFKNPFERPSASWNWDAKSPWQIVPTFSAWQDPV